METPINVSSETQPRRGLVLDDALLKKLTCTTGLVRVAKTEVFSSVEDTRNCPLLCYGIDADTIYCTSPIRSDDLEVWCPVVNDRPSVRAVGILKRSTGEHRVVERGTAPSARRAVNHIYLPARRPVRARRMLSGQPLPGDKLERMRKCTPRAERMRDGLEQLCR
ncbi:hypothetical protein J6590_015589 [Homalodisca vitripennis]|nr:hypothetical protein J6590_015589 [Homalodisca vitripennis]